MCGSFGRSRRSGFKTTNTGAFESEPCKAMLTTSHTTQFRPGRTARAAHMAAAQSTSKSMLMPNIANTCTEPCQPHLPLYGSSI